MKIILIDYRTAIGAFGTENQLQRFADSGLVILPFFDGARPQNSRSHFQRHRGGEPADAHVGPFVVVGP